MTDIMIYIIITFYILSTISYLSYLITPKNYFPKVGFYFLLTGFLIQTGITTYEFVQLGHIPVRDLRETLMIISWSLAGVFILIRYKFNLRILGAFAAPLAAFIMIVASQLPGVQVVASDIFKNPLFAIHIVVIFIGEASFALAFGLGVMYILQERAIKLKNHGYFFKRLPSLEIMDQMGYVCIVAGFTLLTTGLVVGFIYAKAVWGRLLSWDPKEVWSGISWLLYAALLHARLSAGWRGRKSAIMAIIGFLILLFTFFGVNFLFTGHHENFTKW